LKRVPEKMKNHQKPCNVLQSQGSRPPESFLGDPKIAPRDPKIASDESKIGPGAAKSVPRDPKIAPGDSKSTPGGSQDLKMASRSPQNRSQRGPEGPNGAPGSLLGIGTF